MSTLRANQRYLSLSMVLVGLMMMLSLIATRVAMHVQFIERMMVKYHQQAVEQRVLIVPCCGFDSIPADCGATYAQQQFKQVWCSGIGAREALPGTSLRCWLLQAYPNGVVNGLEVR